MALDVNDESQNTSTQEVDDLQASEAQSGIGNDKPDDTTNQAASGTQTECQDSNKEIDQMSIDELGLESSSSKSWKVSPGFAFLGIVGSIVAVILINTAIACAWTFWANATVANGGTIYLEDQEIVVRNLGGIICAVATAIYLLAVYTSLFTNKPRLTSKRTISFLNFFFGGLVFGSWPIVALVLFGIIFGKALTSALNKEKPGTSRGILLGLSIVAVIWMGLSMFSGLADPYVSRYGVDGSIGHQKTPYTGQPGTSNTAAETYVNKEAGFAVDFPGTPEYDKSEVETYGIKYTRESWTVTVNNSEDCMVGRVVYPSDFPFFENDSAINGGLGSALISICMNFDIPPEQANIQYGSFLGYPSAYTSFTFDGRKVMVRAFIRDTTLYIIFAGMPTQKQSEAFVSSFTLL